MDTTPQTELPHARTYAEIGSASKISPFEQNMTTGPLKVKLKAQEPQHRQYHNHKPAGLERFRNFVKLRSHSRGSEAGQPSSDRSSNNVEVLVGLSGEDSDAVKNCPAIDTNSYTDDTENPNVLAERIRQLIISLPAIVATPDNESSADTIHVMPKFNSHLTHDLDASSCPPPPPPPSAILINDEHLINVLSNPLIMNGGKEEKQPTVWSILLSLAPPSYHQGDEPGNMGNTSISYNHPDTSVMLYLPLQPKTQDEVELAESQHIQAVVLPTLAFLADDNGSARAEHVVTAGWRWWPFHSKKKDQIPGIPKVSSQTPSTPTPGVPKSTKSSLPPIPTQATKKIWLPSRTKFSIEATWWGYRIFLPPPLMAILNNDELTLVNRAAMISAALTWLFAQIPIAVFPPPLQPVVLVLQGIVPYINYIGTFISWTWESVKEYDTGEEPPDYGLWINWLLTRYGVILNATWLLPVALIPSTWKVDSFPCASPNISSTKERAKRIATTTMSLPGVTPNMRTDANTTLDVADVSTPLAMKHSSPQETSTSSSSSFVADDVFAVKGDVAQTPYVAQTPLSPLIGGTTRFVEALEENEMMIAGSGLNSPVVGAAQPLGVAIDSLVIVTANKLEPVVEEGVEDLEEDVLPVADFTPVRGGEDPDTR
ncbi:hypothetical protein F5051DRAFT_484968 [Lentinula edodes]|nr:hypothetical protein F5051DRAFT_484968 [Lentinula edodes]